MTTNKTYVESVVENR